MATRKHHPLMKMAEDGFTEGFDVIVESVIGTVSLSNHGGLTPYQAAFALIANHGKQGTFRFPGQDEGQTIVVSVVWEVGEQS